MAAMRVESTHLLAMTSLPVFVSGRGVGATDAYPAGPSSAAGMPAFHSQSCSPDDGTSVVVARRFLVDGALIASEKTGTLHSLSVPF